MCRLLQMDNFTATLTPNWMKTIRLIACDMDGTLTWQGKFCDRLLALLQQLEAINLPLVIVTGRSAGWVSGLVEYLPIAGAIAENGGLFFSRDYPTGFPLLSFTPTPAAHVETTPVHATPFAAHRQQLADLFEGLRHDWPTLVPSADNPYRLTDWTFDIGNLSPQALAGMQEYCHERGWGFTYSSIQCHLKRAEQSKQAGLLTVMNRAIPGWAINTISESEICGSEVLTFGDSPNDETLFDPSVFPYSVGVANLSPYLKTLNFQPQWITTQPEFDGVAEFLQRFLHGREVEG